MTDDSRMRGVLDDPWARALREQLRLEEYLEARSETLELGAAGLRDLDITFGLANCKLSVALMCLRRISAGYRETRLRSMAGERARRAAAILAEVSKENVSLDQRELVEQHPGRTKARELLNELLLEGGGVFFSEDPADERGEAVLSGIISNAVRKYAPPDDGYEPLVRTEKLGAFLRNIVNTFFRVLAPENQAEPPYGIEHPDDEQTLASDRIQLPLSQAIHYYEHEVIPELETALDASPGDPDIQKRINEASFKVREFRQLRFIPRPKPFVMPHGYYTEGLTQYTEDGELLVRVDLPVVQRSGLNIDRQMELVQDEVARQAAGRGLSPELDRELESLKKLSSGRRGDSRFPRSKLNTRRGFRQLKHRFPAVGALEDRAAFKALLVVAAEKNLKGLQTAVKRMVFEKRTGRRFLE